jgi:Family of unknown function (DUF5927)/Core-2/I-Branching enzyme
MSVGFVMLVHNSLERAAEVARHWAGRDCPVVIHLDTRVPAAAKAVFKASLRDVPNLRILSLFACEWGTWAIVQATQAASERMLADFPGARHVFLASGSCLPLRPVAALREYLDARPQTDFIESVATEDVVWTVGGLNRERFTLRFPFSWRKRRRLFDGYVRLQRRVGFQRRIPEGIEPHLGSQWWCLTRQTLSAILEAPERGARDRYFRRVWIPDEAYFQSLARLYSRNLESRSMTLSKFDFQGKPHLFFDDHLQLLRKSDCFVARKIWPQAQKLYDAFLSDDPAKTAGGEPNPGKIDRLFAGATDRRTRSRAGLYSQCRFPRPGWEGAKSAAPYAVFHGFADLFEDFARWMGKLGGTRVHGHLFAPDRAEFAGGETVYNGALPDTAELRDYNPQAFLANLIWNTRGEQQMFQFSPRDRQDIVPFLASDGNAKVFILSGAWAIPLFRANASFSDLRHEAARLQRIELAALEQFEKPWVRARLRKWSLAEFIENPMEHLQEVVDEVAPRHGRTLTEAPRMADLKGFGKFVENLRNQGMQPVLVGDISVSDAAPHSTAQRPRPTLIR